MHSPDLRVRPIFAALLFVLVLPITALAQSLTPEDVVRLQSVSAVSVSPDGEHVAYTVTRPRTEEEAVGPVFSELWVVSTTGDDPTPLVQHPMSASMPSWTPDGSFVTFTARVRDQHDQSQVYGVSPSGGAYERLSGSPTGVMQYEISPDGSRIAYTTRDPEPEEIVEWRAKGYDMIVAGEGDRHTRLYTEQLRGGDRRAVTPDTLTIRDFTWSPDGSTFALMTTTGVGADDDLMFRKIHTVSADGGPLTHLTHTEGKLGPMRWSPDGRHLAYLSAIAFNDPLPHSVYVVSAEGGEARNLTPNYEGTAEWLGWLDDDIIVFTAMEGTLSALNTIPRDGGAVMRIAGHGREIFRSASVDQDGRVFALPVNQRTHPNEVYTSQYGTGIFERLTRHNAFLDDIELGEQETIEWTAPDGMRMEGVVIRPVGFQEGTRYPLAVLPHGGPEGISFDGWITNPLYPGQVLAANGYVVFEPNYRGSGGRGPAFSMANHRDLGGMEFEDVLSGIDYLAEQGLIDPDRVGMSGTSYGGYFSAWAGTRHTDRFAATITFAGLSNWISFMGTTDIPHEMSVVHWDLYWWEDPELNWDRSPVAHIPGANTPILVAHGLADERVHPEQSIQLHQFLELHEIPTGLVLYPREPHGLRERAHQLDFMNRVIEWFDRYLKDEEEPASG